MNDLHLGGCSFHFAVSLLFAGLFPGFIQDAAAFSQSAASYLWVFQNIFIIKATMDIHCIKMINNFLLKLISLFSC